MKRAFIHIGMPKTGSTAIQTMLVEERDLLLKHGLFHPDTRDSNRLAILAHCHADAIERNYLAKRNVTQDEADALAAELWRQIGTAEGDIVLSCEQLYRGEETADTIVRDFSKAGFEPVIVCYFRHPVDASISAAQQGAKMGRRSLEENVSDPFWPKCKVNISYFVDTGVKIIARSYAEARKTGTPKDFLKAIGYAEAATKIADVVSNKSLSMDGALLADVYWRYMQKHGKRPFPRRFLLEIDGPRFVTPKATRDKVRALAQFEVDWVHETFGIELTETPNTAEFYDRPRPEALVDLMRLIQQNTARKRKERQAKSAR